MDGLIDLFDAVRLPGMPFNPLDAVLAMLLAFVLGSS